MKTFVKSLKRIRINYFKTWFTIDLIASLPIDEILTLSLPNTQNNETLLKFSGLKILRLTRFAKVFSRLNHLSHTTGFICLLMVFILLAHWAACVWHLIGYQVSTTDIDNSWLYINNLYYASVPERYIGSLYWALMTITTIGYGDLNGVRYEERIYSCIVMFLGALIYALIFAMVSLLLGEIYPLRENI